MGRLRHAIAGIVIYFLLIKFLINKMTINVFVCDIPFFCACNKKTKRNIKNLKIKNT